MKSWEPREYQLEGIKHLLSNANAGLWFDPGMGKTSVVLATIKVLRSKGLINRALIVAPVRVATEVWSDEVKKWADFHDLKVFVLHGPKKSQWLHQSIPLLKPDIVTCSPEGLVWLCEGEGTRLQDLGADMLVVDESTYFRNHSTKRFRSLRTHLSSFKRRVTLTGTPAPRSYEDLWAQAFIMDQGNALERFISHYRVKYFRDNSYSNTYADWVVRPECVPIINDKLQPFVLRGDALGNVPMPDLLLNSVKVELPTYVMDKYRSMERHFIESFQGEDVMSPNTAALGNKLRQIASGFIYDANGTALVLHNEKISAIINLLQELQGKRALILYEFTATRDALLHAMRNTHGPISDVKTIEDDHIAQIIHGFNAGEFHLLAHPASVGHGLNLQESSQHVIWVGPTWNLEHYEQAIRRVWRQGNTHATVTVHTINADKTMDDVVIEVLTEKNATQQRLLAAMKR